MKQTKIKTSSNILVRSMVFATILLMSVLGASAQTNITANTSLSIMPWYPQANNYVFVCDNNFGATQFDFDYGDGERIYDLTTNNVYHTFDQDGEFEVSCTATNGAFSQVSLLRVGIGTEQTVAPIDGQSAELVIAPYFPQGPNGLDYVFNCNAQGFVAETYAWDFGDGQKLYNMPTNDVFHRFDQAGSYVVNCAASNSEYRVGASKIIAGGIPETPFVDNSTNTTLPPTNTTLPPTNTTNTTTVTSAALSVAPYYPKMGDYVFVCDTAGFVPTGYDWVFGDGSKLNDMTSDDVWHTYTSSGMYNVSCIATDGISTEESVLEINATV